MSVRRVPRRFTLDRFDLNGVNLRSLLFQAAKANNHLLIKSRLLYRTAEEIKEVVSGKVDGATLLVTACRNGAYDVAEYLVERIGVNIEETGSVTFDGEPIEDAPPLWCAAAAGHLGIVQLLLANGANVNSKTRTNSTPLRAACFDGHYEIVKFLIERQADFEVPNRHGHTCLMIACYKGHYAIVRHLLKSGAKVNRASVKGNTAMHDCAEAGSLEIMKLLLQYGGKMSKDSYGMTPLLAASVTGNTPIVEHMITLRRVSRQECLDALELLGATLVDKQRDIAGAMRQWMRALNMRNREPVMPKELAEPEPAYENVTEFTTTEELNNLFANPDGLRMQALIIRQRILGAVHSDTTYYIRYRGAHYADAGRFDRCIELWTYALSMQQKLLPPLDAATQQSIHSFAELFAYMLVETGRQLPRGRVVPPVSAYQMLVILEKTVREIENGLNLSQIISVVAPDLNARGGNKKKQSIHLGLVSALHIACMIITVTEDQPDISPERLRTIELLRQLNQSKYVAADGRTLLHLACNREPRGTTTERYPALQFPSLPLIKVLLSIGANPNAVDNEGNMPLHLLTTYQDPSEDVVRKLLECGAHLDAANKFGQTFESMLDIREIYEYVDPLKYTSLACLAARKIKESALKYKGEVPLELYAFIEKH